MGTYCSEYYNNKLQMMAQKQKKKHFLRETLKKKKVFI